MSLLKAFNTINYKLLIAELHAYSLDISSYKILWSYLTNRWESTKIDTAFSSWTEITRGIP